MEYIIINSLTLALLLLIFDVEAFNYSKFCVNNPNNTLCIYPAHETSTLCNEYTEKIFENAEKRKALLWHLELREKALREEFLDLPASIYWDAMLATMAQRWASQCNASQDLNRNYGNISVYQNVFTVASLNDSIYDIIDIFKKSVYHLTETDFMDKLKSWKVFKLGCGGCIYTLKFQGGFYEIVCNYVPVIKRKTEKRRGFIDPVKSLPDFAEQNEEEEERKQEYEDGIEIEKLLKDSDYEGGNGGDEQEGKQAIVLIDEEEKIEKKTEWPLLVTILRSSLVSKSPKDGQKLRNFQRTHRVGDSDSEDSPSKGNRNMSVESQLHILTTYLITLLVLFFKQ